MWKSRRIASAQDSCNRKREKHSGRREERKRGSDKGDLVCGCAVDEEEQEEEKSRLVSCGNEDGLCYCKNSCSLCRLPFRTAMAGKGFTSTLRTFMSCHLKKLPGTARMHTYYDAAKRKCIDSFRGPSMCLPFGFSAKEGKKSAEFIGICLMELGIHVHAPLLLAHRRFTLQELRMATSHFAEKNRLGNGSSGCVYRGELVSTCESIAVKLLNVRSRDARLSFATELEVMYRVCNHHIQPLLGYCSEDGRLLLVYSYMPQGSVEDSLHGGYKRSKLSWHDRCKVAFGIMKALHYLHTECKPPIIHRDIKPSNILLTTFNEAKLTDFGLAIQAFSPYFICKDVMGTFGYLSPEYFQFGKVSTKMDIYSLGILLLELTTGRYPIDNGVPLEQANLANWAIYLLFNAQDFAVQMADPLLGMSYSLAEMQRLLYISALCIHPLDSCRPSISQVLELMQEERVVRLRYLVSEAYKDAASTLNCRLSSPGTKGIVKSDEDLRKQYMQMAMQDVERNSLLSSPLIDL